MNDKLYHPYFSMVFDQTLRSMIDTDIDVVAHSGTWESIILPNGIQKPPKDTFETTLQNNMNIKAFSILREERNKKLLETDWTQFPNSPLSEIKKQEWFNYRQALRDLPSNTIDPENPVWPTPPQ